MLICWYLFNLLSIMTLISTCVAYEQQSCAVVFINCMLHLDSCSVKQFFINCMLHIDSCSAKQYGGICPAHELQPMNSSPYSTVFFFKVHPVCKALKQSWITISCIWTGAWCCGRCFRHHAQNQGSCMRQVSDSRGRINAQTSRWCPYFAASEFALTPAR